MMTVTRLAPLFAAEIGSVDVSRPLDDATWAEIRAAFEPQSNLDIETGAVIPPEDRRMVYQLANMLWHSDSSFKKVPALCSLLSARIVPPEGGATEFASARRAYAALPEARKRELDGLVVVHAVRHKRLMQRTTVSGDPAELADAHA